MPVSTKQKHRPRRTTSYRPHPTKRRRATRRAPSIPRSWKVPTAPWLALAGIAAVSIVLWVTAPLLVAAFEGLLNAFGIGLALVVVAATVDARLALRRPLLDWRLLRIWAGLHMLGLASFGALALFTPDWEVGDVAFREVTAGGDLGGVFTGSSPGVAAWLLIAATGITLTSPRTTRAAGRGGLAVLRAVASLNIPQAVGGVLKSFFASLLPRAEEEAEEDKLLQAGYVPQWDEEWTETPPNPAVEPPVLVDDVEGPDELYAGAGDEAFQGELPMGRPAGHGWELPPLDLLAEASEVELRPVDNEARAQLIIETLASFGVDARVVSVNQGPTVTQFGVEPGWETKTRSVPMRDERGRPAYDRDGRPQVRSEVVSRTRVRVNKITGLANDLALALAAPTIRIEAPVPGKPIIGIEVPNTTTSLVAIRSVIESVAFGKANTRSRLAIALGKGVSGEPLAADLARMPHLLIAGATGSGKSVCINSVIASLLLHNTPEELRLVLIDPKRVELATFATIPHLAFSKVITDTEEIVGTLQAIIHEMDSRYRRFADIGVRNIEAFNKSPRASHRLPYWVVIIDELADLMMASPYEVERQLCRLAQLARATGIHLIVATQRPSVDVVTGLIKANFPTRIAFAVSSQVDSRTIIDGAGAEKLLGRGDMLFMPTDASKPKRIQGSYVSDMEIERIVAWWTSDRFRHLAPDKLDHLLEEAEGEEISERLSEDDPLYEAAKDHAVRHSRVSTSMLQRRLHIGYPRAARLIDLLEEDGIVGGAEGGQSRIVLISGDRAEGDEDRFE